MTKLKYRVVPPIGVVCMCVCSASHAQPQDSTAVARRLYTRVTGVPLLQNDERTEKMARLVQEGKPLQAALIATEDRAFYNNTIREFATEMATPDEDPSLPLTDFVAMFMGVAADKRDARTLLYGNFSYAGSISAARSSTSNRHYEQLEVQFGTQISQKLTYVEPQFSNIPEAAGVFTSYGWARANLEGGTNRRSVEQAFKQFLCTPIEALKDINTSDARVRRDIDRAPSGRPREYQTNCRGCHGGMDGNAGAFARFDFVNGAIVYFSGSFVASKMNQNSTQYPSGYVTYDDSWINFWTERHNALLGWRGPVEGQGVRAWGEMMANSQGFSSCMAKRAFTKMCRKVPGGEDAAAVKKLAEDFESDGYLFTKLFARAASLPSCLGTQ